MNKTLSSASIAVSLGLAAAVVAPSASALTLSVTAGSHDCLVADDPTHWTGCSFGAPTNVQGSYFDMGGSFANDISSSVGLNVGPGTAQPYVGDPVSAATPVSLTGSAGNISDPWLYFSLTQYGVNFTVSDILLTDTATAGVASADMSGWRVAWSEVPEINMGEGDPGTFTYDGSNWALDYSAVVPAGDPSGFGGTAYDLHLEGTYTGDLPIASIPVPAAVWLFGSGMLGLVGVARRRKAA